MQKSQLFFLVGASGSGKDSILREIRRQAVAGDRIAIVHRYITRAADDRNENHVALTEEEFFVRKKASCFAMHWEANGLYYGVGVEINYWLDAGINVVVNGSREYLPKALSLYPDLVTMNVAVPNHLLKERLLKRGRESTEEIEQRFGRSSSLIDVFPENTHVLDNSESVGIAVDQFYQFLRESL